MLTYLYYRFITLAFWRKPQRSVYQSAQREDGIQVLVQVHVMSLRARCTASFLTKGLTVANRKAEVWISAVTGAEK